MLKKKKYFLKNNVNYGQGSGVWTYLQKLQSIVFMAVLAYHITDENWRCCDSDNHY